MALVERAEIEIPISFISRRSTFKYGNMLLEMTWKCDEMSPASRENPVRTSEFSYSQYKIRQCCCIKTG